MTQSTAHAHPSHPPSSAHPHRRTPSFNPPKVKSARPTLHRRSTTHHSILKLGSGQPKQQSVVHENSHSEMAASFLNFWYVVIFLILLVCLSANPLHSTHSLFLRLTLSCSAMCERQITVPDNSLLYCSERSVFAYKNLSLPPPNWDYLLTLSCLQLPSKRLLQTIVGFLPYYFSVPSYDSSRLTSHVTTNHCASHDSHSSTSQFCHPDTGRPS